MDFAPAHLSAALLLAGIGAMIAALAPLRALRSDLPPGPLQRKWHLHTSYLAGLAVAWACHALATLGHYETWPSVLAPALLLASALMIWRTAVLARRTTAAVHRSAPKAPAPDEDRIDDPLTGAHNARYLLRRIDEEYQRAVRYRQPLALLHIDIDRFGAVNERHGRAAADALLRECAALCMATVRSTDIVARHGSDELAVIAPNTAPAQALVLAERLRRAAEQHAVMVEDAHGLPYQIGFTVCIGVTAIGPHTAGPQALVAAARDALARARSQGRSQVFLDLGARAADRASSDAMAAVRPCGQTVGT